MRNGELVIDNDLLVLKIMWLMCFLNIAYLNNTTKLLIQVLGCAICGIYVLCKVTKGQFKTLVPVAFFVLSMIIPSILNRNNNGSYITYSGILYAVKILLYFSVMLIVVTRKGVLKATEALLQASYLYWFPSIITVLMQGRDVVDNASDVYFIGNKFAIAYLQILMCCFYSILLSNQKKKESHNILTLKIRALSLKASLFMFSAFGICFYMKAYTGIFIIVFMIGLWLLDYTLSFRKSSGRMVGFINVIKKPIIVIAAIIASGLVVIALDAISQIPVISNLLSKIGKQGTIYSRIMIYENLGKIISTKPWFGYGQMSSIVSQFYGPNAQNGVMQYVIYTGFIGFLFLLFLTYYCIKKGSQYDLKLCSAILFGIYAFILSATIEITLSSHLLFLLAFYLSVGEICKIQMKEMGNHS